MAVSRRTLWSLGVVAVVAVTATVWLVTAMFASSSGTPELEPAARGVTPDYHYLIPLGTGRRIDAGEQVEILPAELVAHVGETIQIVNDDDRGHTAGPFYVAAGQTLTQTFTSPGTLAGLCSVHPSGQFVLDVLA